MFDSGYDIADNVDDLDIGRVHRRVHLVGSSGHEVLNQDHECSLQVRKLKQKKKKKRRSMNQRKRKMASPGDEAPPEDEG